MERVVSAMGSLAPWDQAALSVKVAGRVAAIEVDLGSEVKRGDRVARLESRDYELRLLQAQAALTQARARLGLPLEGSDDKVAIEDTGTVKQARALLHEATRTRERAVALNEDKILSDSELEAAKAQYEVAVSRLVIAEEEIRNRQGLLAEKRAELEIARQELSYTEIRAPFDGVVQERRANTGEYLPIGSPVATLMRNDPLRLRLEISERDAVQVRAGQTVRLSSEGSSTIHGGLIQRLSPGLQPQSRMLVVEANVDNPQGRLRPGSFVEASIVTEANESTLTIPGSAVVAFAGIEKAFIVQDGKALEKTIATGRRVPPWVEVLDGLKAGQVVVVEPAGLRTGQAVESGGPQMTEVR